MPAQIPEPAEPKNHGPLNVSLVLREKEIEKDFSNPNKFKEFAACAADAHFASAALPPVYFSTHADRFETDGIADCFH